MRIFNENKTKELNRDELDFNLGYLKEDILIHHIKEQEEVQQEVHYEVIKEYENGGQDVEEIIDVPYQPYIPEHDEEEQIQVYVKYTKNELRKREINNRINELLNLLYETDYIANKLSEAISKYIIEGDNTNVITLREKYATELTNRELWRNEISSLKDELSSID